MDIVKNVSIATIIAYGCYKAYNSCKGCTFLFDKNPLDWKCKFSCKFICNNKDEHLKKDTYYLDDDTLNCINIYDKYWFYQFDTSNFRNPKINHSYCGKCYTFHEVLYKHPKVKHLCISNNDNIKNISNINTLKSLRIQNCHSIETISNLTKLEHIYVFDCKSLKRIINVPNGNPYYVYVSSCPILTQFDVQIVSTVIHLINGPQIIKCPWIKDNLKLIRTKDTYPDHYYLGNSTSSPEGTAFLFLDNLDRKIKKLIIIQRLWRWKKIKKVFNIKISKDILDNIIKYLFILGK